MACKQRKRGITRKYFMRTLANKVVAIFILLCGIISRLISGEADALVFTIVLALPLLLAKRNYIVI